MRLSDYIAQDGLGLAGLIRNREVSVEDVLDCARRMIEAVNPKVNAVIERYAEPLAGNDDRSAPFYGVPFVVKDLVIHATGQRCEMGSRLAKGLTFQHDTDLMARFRQAGLRTVARTTSPEFGYCPTTETVANGPTRNPWDTTRMAGGSSGGSAASVAAGIVPLGHANDGGGSIRIPAACCGLVGLKPTRARTPIGPDSAEGLNGMGVEFAVTRTVRDCAALLDAVQGPGLGDPYVAPAPATTYVEAMNRRPQPLRIAVATTAWDRQKTDPACVKAVESVAKQCEALGHTIVEASPTVDWDEFVVNCMAYWTSNLAVWIGELAKALGRPIDSTTIESTTLACYRHGLGLKATDLLHAMEFCNRLTRSFAAFFQSHDLLLTPTLPAPPSPLGTINSNDATLDAEGWTRKVFEFTPYTPLFNMTGQPAISLPLVRTARGLPIGIQFVARYGAEDTLVNLAAQLERAMPWPQVSPLATAAAG